MRKILDDCRPITELCYLDGDVMTADGEDGIAFIRPYYDEGYLWFAMLDENEEVLGRVPQSAVLYVWYGA